jgi:pimeloyl-ACP methyl ester carboxylesterase
VIPDERSVTAPDGVAIAFDVCGHGAPALVFVHGWSGRRSHWDAQLGPFAATHTVVRIDLAGHGSSGRDRARWTVSSFADDVVAVVDALALDQVILVGHSLGGSVIALAARRLPGRARGLIGIDTWSALGVRSPVEVTESSVMLPEMRADFAAGASRFAEAMCGPSAGPGLRARIIDEVTAMPPQIALGSLEEAIRQGPDDIERALCSLEVPRSAISSETFRPKDPRVLASFGIRNVVVPGTGHYLMLERPAVFNAQLAAAVARCAVIPAADGSRPPGST